MLVQVRTALAEIAARFADTRLQYCQVEAVSESEDQFTLTGAVLDPATYGALADELLARFPDVCFDGSRVAVLRSPTPETAAVATNLAGLHAGPSFESGLLSQLLNGAPLEVLKTAGAWAFVRLADGYLGWAYRPYLVSPAALEPTHLVAAPVCLLGDAAGPDAAPVTRLFGGTYVAVSRIEGDRARLALAGELAGWAAGADLRSLAALPVGETARRRQMAVDAQRLVGVPYQWGGCTALGIDCSGFVQLVHRLSGLDLPRDADLQHAAGRPVEPPFLPGDLLFFAEASAPHGIGHVAMSLGGWQVIHASRRRNGVYLDDVQAVPLLRDSLMAARSFVLAGEPGAG